MKPKKVILFTLLVMALALVLAACQPETVEVTRVTTVTETETITEEIPVTVVVTETETETIEVTRQVEVTVVEEMAPLGSAERPIKVLFVPSQEADVLVSSGEIMADALTEATGLEYEVSVPNSYAATIESMCASPDDTIGFIPALGYVLANERCGVQVGIAAVRFGWPVYWSQIVVRSDSGIESLEDLDGKKWGVPSVTSTSGFLVPRAMLSAAGIEPSEVVEFGGSHTSSMLAVANGEVDFATAFFSPPLLPDRRWNPAVDDPEIWRDAGVAPEIVDGRVFVAGGPNEGGYRILDARNSAMATYPEIFEETRILMISDEIPNDTLSFGSEFPFGLAQQIASAVRAYASSDACQEPPEGVVTFCSDASYNWTGAELVNDANFDPIRFIIDSLGLTDEDILN